MPERFFCWRSCFCGWRRKSATAQSACRTYFPKVWLAKDAENDSFGKEEASALAEALLHCADRLEQERSEPLEVVWNAELGAWAAQTVLSREEAEKLLSFAKEQGFPDRERQRQWMLRLSGEFKSRAESVFEKAASEKRMVLSVSLAAGALVVVLFW